MALGGFDTSLRCREDYELGYRINAAGLRFRLITGAAAKHRETSDLAKAMRRKFDEGIAEEGARRPRRFEPLCRVPQGGGQCRRFRMLDRIGIPLDRRRQFELVLDPPQPRA